MDSPRIYNWGPFLIMGAASLWALDALFRTQLTGAVPPIYIVLIEHTLGFFFLSPFFFAARKKFRTLTLKDWGILIVLTVVSSVLGTLLFTEALARSFTLLDFATPVLLLKLQPIFTIALAAVFLRERLTLRFLALVPIALIGGYMISFGAEPVTFHFAEKGSVVLLAVGAAFCWGSGTVLSKAVLNRLTFAEATAMRFLLAIPVSAIFALGLHQTYDVLSLTSGQIVRFLIIALATGGAASVLIYYRGLRQTEAKISTMAELAFPVISIVIAVTSLNPYGQPQILTLANSFGIALLLISVLTISMEHASQRPPE